MCERMLASAGRGRTTRTGSIQRVCQAVVCRKLQFVEFGPRLGAPKGSSKGRVKPLLVLAARGRGRPEEQRAVHSPEESAAGGGRAETTVATTLVEADGVGDVSIE
jgi:hypothetical protein